MNAIAANEILKIFFSIFILISYFAENSVNVTCYSSLHRAIFLNCE
jgi:hypothetical protein